MTRARFATVALMTILACGAPRPAAAASWDEAVAVVRTGTNLLFCALTFGLACPVLVGDPEPPRGGSGCPVWECGTNSPIVDGAAIDVSRRAGVEDIAAAGASAASRSPIEDWFCTAFPFMCSPPTTSGGTCPEWACGENSPIVDGATINVSIRAGVEDSAAPRSPIEEWFCETFPFMCPPPTTTGGPCPEWECGSNSPIVDGAAMGIADRAVATTTTRAFHELHLGGLPNAAGFSVVGARKGTIPYAIDVEGATVIARPRTAGAVTLEGAALVGLVLDLRDAENQRYDLRIAGTDTTSYWAGAPGSIRAYILTYSSAAKPNPRPLCTAGANEAILFGGDRYDADRKTVTAVGPATHGWINIACAGTPLAKLYLTRHTEGSQVVVTSAPERQAMFKMFTADVCGDGTAFTVHGQPLLWADAKGITTFRSAPASIEAIWNDRGAVCLDTPRRPELAAAIASRCARPTCGGATTPLGQGHVISANPR